MTGAAAANDDDDDDDEGSPRPAGGGPLIALRSDGSRGRWNKTKGGSDVVSRDPPNGIDEGLGRAGMKGIH
jgi:hypothetical protein